MPHGMCLLWNSRLIGLRIAADAGIAFACYFLAGGLIRLTCHRVFGNVLGRGVSFGLTALFIGCGTIQVLDIVTVWRAYYWLDVYCKVATAIIAAATASVFWPVAKHYLGGFFVHARR